MTNEILLDQLSKDKALFESQVLTFPEKGQFISKKQVRKKEDELVKMCDEILSELIDLYATENNKDKIASLERKLDSIYDERAKLTDTYSNLKEEVLDFPAPFEKHYYYEFDDKAGKWAVYVMWDAEKADKVVGHYLSQKAAKLAAMDYNKHLGDKNEKRARDQEKNINESFSKQDIEDMLAAVNKKIEMQGRIVDDRLLSKKEQLEKVLKSEYKVNDIDPLISKRAALSKKSDELANEFYKNPSHEIDNELKKIVKEIKILDKKIFLAKISKRELSGEVIDPALLKLKDKVEKELASMSITEAVMTPIKWETAPDSAILIKLQKLKFEYKINPTPEKKELIQKLNSIWKKRCEESEEISEAKEEKLTHIKLPAGYDAEHEAKIIVQKGGLVIHKGFTNTGWKGKPNLKENNMYQVSLMSNGFSLVMGDGFKKLGTAKKYLLALLDLMPDWSHVESRSDIDDIFYEIRDIQYKLLQEEK